MKTRLSLSNIPIGRKFALISILFATPILVLVYLLAQNINDQISLSFKEEEGVRFVLPITQIARDLVLYSKERGSNKSREHALSQEIDIHFGELLKVYDQLGQNLNFTPEGLARSKIPESLPSAMQQEWEAIKSDAYGRETNSKIFALFSDAQNAILHATDHSNLILDPDLDSYYVMDTAMLAIPATAAELAKLYQSYRPLFDYAKIDQEDRIELSTTTTLLQNNIARIQSSIRTALNEDPFYYGKSDSFQKTSLKF